MPNIVTIIGEAGNEVEVDLDLATEGILERIENGSLTVVEKAKPSRAKKADTEDAE